jgi:hypothetical protein
MATMSGWTIIAQQRGNCRSSRFKTGYGLRTDTTGAGSEIRLILAATIGQAAIGTGR